MLSKKKINYLKNNIKYSVRFLLPMMLMTYGKFDFLAKMLLKEEDMLKEIKKDEET